ncbi:MAG: mechanosensitive ion channel domain-containing protein [Bdellovibrionota bacterium]|nr:hypothetical protein [Pseudobdellovibrionaceae bacterium]|tara:strand:- start:4504 stop:5286 length:783 start_codon:yes stop_codon:yes gene_type:complete
MDVNEAIDTNASDDDFVSLTKRRAKTSIETRFNFIRKTFIPLVIFISVLLIAIPHLPAISGPYISLFAGAIAVLIGIASKPLLENMVSGVVITLSQPIRINDTVIVDDKYGTVEKINLLYTVIKVWNFRRYNIPNSKFLQKEFENLSQVEEFEWVHVEFYVSPESDLAQVKQIAKDAMRTQFLADIEPPSFWVMELGKDSIRCWVAGWAHNPAEAWALKSSSRKRLATRLAKAGIKAQMTNNRVKVEGNHPVSDENLPFA